MVVAGYEEALGRAQEKEFIVCPFSKSDLRQRELKTGCEYDVTVAGEFGSRQQMATDASALNPPVYQDCSPDHLGSAKSAISQKFAALHLE